MALVTMPTGGVRSIEWTMPQRNVFVTRSQWTGRQSVGDLGTVTAGWKAKLILTDRRVATLSPWRAFAALMRGPVNVCQIPVTEGVQTSFYGFAQVNGSGQTGVTLTVRHPTPSVTLLKAGQIITISTTIADTQTFVLTDDLITNSSSLASAHLDFPMRFAWADGVSIVIGTPYVLSRLVTPASGWSVSPGAIYTPAALDFEEVI